MKICGLKLTHDGGLAVLENGQLMFSLEMEKLNNSFRHRSLNNLALIPEILSQFGYGLDAIDLFVVDGWDGRTHSTLPVKDGTKPLKIQAAPYVEESPGGLLRPFYGTGLALSGRNFTFESYPHLAGHLASAWLTSPYAGLKQTADCLIWDGSIFPRLYRIDPDSKTVTWRGNLFRLIGHVYAIAGEYFGPYRRDRKYNRLYDLGIAGKLMAYIGLGQVSADAVELFSQLYHRHFESDDPASMAHHHRVAEDGSTLEAALAQVHQYFSMCQSGLAGHADENILASFHHFLERLLIERLSQAVDIDSIGRSPNLCLVGGCALNIKWNSAIRASGLYQSVWAPPFPNDSGSAIGAAGSALMARSHYSAISWDVYSGPHLRSISETPPGWRTQSCSIADLAQLLATGEPVVFLSGQAELGPRALGARSMLAAATGSAMKDLLNTVKRREAFRPVAPICLEDRAPEIFDPGSPDPFMLFEHQIRAHWKDRIPAVIHLDGTARLQTVQRDANTPIARLLVAYEKLTGIPLLCNTSANYSGKGFFPDVGSACDWGMIDQVWSEETLYTRMI